MWPDSAERQTHEGGALARGCPHGHKGVDGGESEPGHQTLDNADCHQPTGSNSVNSRDVYGWFVINGIKGIIFKLFSSVVRINLITWQQLGTRYYRVREYQFQPLCPPWDQIGRRSTLQQFGCKGSRRKRLQGCCFGVLCQSRTLHHSENTPNL